MPTEPYNQDRLAQLRKPQRLVIGHPFIGRGGSEARVMWLIEALKRDFDVTVMTTGGWDLPALNSYYGTRVAQEEVKVRIAPVPFFVRHLNAAALRGACFQRFARQIAGEYDIRVSAYNTTDWGLPALHFIADFSWHKQIREQFHPPSPGLIYRNTMARRAYLTVAGVYGRPSDRDVLRDDMVIANSCWSAKIVKQFCGVDCCAIVYPPVSAEFPSVPWENKEQAFVMIGRIAPEKQIERAVAILEAVRQRGHAIQFHLCGPIENDTYGRSIAKICRERSDWIIQEGRVSGTRKAQILSHCRFGIQTSGAEGFGIAVAEMAKAGAIVFASSGGGQTEVLDNPDLLFSSVDDAADKICAVLSNAEKQRALCSYIAHRTEMFSAERFMLAAQTQVKEAALRQQSSLQPVRRRKVVLGHPKLAYGGSESTFMWLIEALKRDFEVTVMTTGGWDLSALNSYYGTQVRQDEVKVRIAPVPFLVQRLSAAALRGACFQRFARQIAGEYDIRVSAYNATDWGLPAFHFIADFSWHREIRNKFHPPSPGFIYRDTLARRIYLRVAETYGRPSGRDILRDDMVIANSHWTAEVVKQFCGVTCGAVLYPPVAGDFPGVPWEQKEQAFAMIGRIAPEKQIERAIEILDTVRSRGHAIQLHLCGPIGNDPYGHRIAQICLEHKDWINLEGRVTGAKKTQILSHCRFGIQTCGAEGFGISVAEMAKAGAIVFAHEEGGQAEILGHPDLLFSDTNEAVEKILRVLEQPSLQSTLRAHLASRARMFSAQHFVREVRALIGDSSPTNQDSELKLACGTS